jgi:hypothetical protein
MINKNAQYINKPVKYILTIVTNYHITLKRLFLKAPRKGTFHNNSSLSCWNLRKSTLHNVSLHELYRYPHCWGGFCKNNMYWAKYLSQAQSNWLNYTFSRVSAKKAILNFSLKCLYPYSFHTLFIFSSKKFI